MLRVKHSRGLGCHTVSLGWCAAHSEAVGAFTFTFTFTFTFKCKESRRILLGLMALDSKCTMML
jgi:hypothetical protein